jgi:hypothetical protein
MTSHVADESLADLAEGGGSDAERAHVGACGPCSARVEDAGAALALARRADVPEPSPLYWEAMRRNVARRTAEEPRGPRWAWLVPVPIAAVLAVFALTAGRTQAPPTPPERMLAAWSALPPAEDDASLEVLAGVAATDADLANLDEGRGVGVFLAGLSDEEGRALVDSLRGAGQGGAS